jgi:sugar fermentation stimulation protein A
LVRATLLRRYKRFLADVRLESGEDVTVHCPNSGKMTSCCEPGRPVILSISDQSGRKYVHTWELIQMGRTWVSVHSASSNKLVRRCIEQGLVPDLQGVVRSEVALGHSRIDLQVGSRYVEVKHSTMRVGRYAAFPDAVSTRAQKHVLELMEVVRRGGQASIVFVIGRGDCARFRPADECDARYGELLRQASRLGVGVLAYGFRYAPGRATLRGRMPVDL